MVYVGHNKFSKERFIMKKMSIYGMILVSMAGIFTLVTSCKEEKGDNTPMLAAAALAVPASATVNSCTFNAGPVQYCMSKSGGTESECTGLGGTFNTGSCTTVGATGTCADASIGVQTLDLTFYSEATTSQTMCETPVASGGLEGTWTAIPPDPGTDPGSSCRTVATDVTGDYSGASGAADVPLTCAYSDTFINYQCTNPAQALYVAYDSKADFVNDASLGAFLYTSSIIQGSYGYSPTRDATKVTSIDGGGYGKVFATTVTAWDASNRPTEGTADYYSGFCTGVPVTITYDDVAGTIRFVFDKSRGTNGSGTCPANKTIEVLTYDANGNLVGFMSDGLADPVTEALSVLKKEYIYTVNVTTDICI